MSFQMAGMDKDITEKAMEIESQGHIEDRVHKLLSKLPQICPKLKKVSNTSQLNGENGKAGNYKEKSCYVCNKGLDQDDEKVVNILTDVTSRMNSVGNILGTIFKTSSRIQKSKKRLKLFSKICRAQS